MVLIWVCRRDIYFVTIYVFSFHNLLSELHITDRTTALSCSPRVTNRNMSMLFVVMVEIC